MIKHSIELEDSYLGSILLMSQDEAQGKIVLLEEKDFYGDVQREVFIAIKKLSKKGNPVDLVTVATELQHQNKLDFIGGAEFLAELQNGVPTETHCLKYAQNIKQMSIIRGLEEFADGLKRAISSNKYTTDEIIARAKGRVEDLSSNKFGKTKPTMTDLYKSFLESKEVEKIATGIEPVDKMTKGGIMAGKFWVLTAFSGVGKTSLIMKLMIKMLDANRTVNFYSLEMGQDEVYGYFERLMGGEDKVNMDKVHYGWKMNFSRERDIDEILFDARRDTPDVVFIDYLQMIQLKQKTSGIFEKTAEIAFKLQTFTRETGIPVVVLSQVSNSQEAQKGGIMHAKGGGDVYASADVFIGIKRDYDEELSIKMDDQVNSGFGSDGHILQREFNIYKNRQGLEGGFQLPWNYRTGQYVF